MYHPTQPASTALTAAPGQAVPASPSSSALARPVKNLVFEGGGVKGAAYAGAIFALEKHGLLAGVERVAGASAGAIAALLISLGHNSKQLEKLMQEVDLPSFQDSPRFTPLGKGADVLRHYGVYRGDAFEAWAKERLRAVTGDPNMTFRGLQEHALKNPKTGTKAPYFIGANLSTGYYEVFSHEHTPDMPIYLAVRISMAIPLFFTPKRYGPHNDLYVDGGLLNNYPLTLFDGEGEENLSTLGFRVDPPEEIAVLKDQQAPERCKIDSFTSYAKALFAAATNVANNHLRLQGQEHRTVYIDTQDVGTTEFKLTPERQQMLVEQGRAATEAFIQARLLANGRHAAMPGHLSDRARLGKHDRYKLYAKAEGIFCRQVGGHAQMQLTFALADSKKIEKWFDHLKRQGGIVEASYGGLAGKVAKPVLAFTGPAALAEEFARWAHKHQAEGKALKLPLDKAAWTPMGHWQRLHGAARLAPPPNASQGKALYDAVQKSDLVAVKRLTGQGATPDWQGEYGETALHVAAERCQLEMLGLLLEHAPGRSIDQADHKGETALHRIMLNDDDPKKLKVLELLLQKGARLEARNKFGSTPLHRAAYWGRLESVKTLIAAGADRRALDHDSATPLQAAQASPRAGASAVAQYLAGLDAQERTIQTQWRIDEQAQGGAGPTIRPGQGQ